MAGSVFRQGRAVLRDELHDDDLAGRRNGDMTAIDGVTLEGRRGLTEEGALRRGRRRRGGGMASAGAEEQQRRELHGTCWQPARQLSRKHRIKEWTAS